MRPRIYARSLLLTVLGVLVASTSSLAGTMSFSVYDDASVSNNRLVAYTTVHDNSSGCTHGSYSTKVTIYSPSQRSATSTASGLQANVSLAISGRLVTTPWSRIAATRAPASTTKSFTMDQGRTTTCRCIMADTRGKAGTSRTRGAMHRPFGSMRNNARTHVCTRTSAT